MSNKSPTHAPVGVIFHSMLDVVVLGVVIGERSQSDAEDFTRPWSYWIGLAALSMDGPDTRKAFLAAANRLSAAGLVTIHRPDEDHVTLGLGNDFFRRWDLAEMAERGAA